MRRVLKWSLRLLAVVAVLVAVGLVLYITVVPGIIRGAILDALAGIGLSDASVNVAAVSPHRVQLTDLALDDQRRFQAAAVSVTYDLAGIRRGRIKTIHAGGVQWFLRVADGRLDLGPLGRIRTDDSASDTLPFDRAELSASTLWIEHNARAYGVPLSGSLVRNSDESCELDVRIGLLDTELRLRGTIGPFGSDSTSHSLQIDIPPGDLTLKTLGAVLLGVSGELKLSAKIESQRLELRLGSGSRVSVGGVAGMPFGLRLKRSDPQTALLSVAADGQDAVFSVGWGSDAQPWLLLVPALGVDVPGANAAVHNGVVQVKALRAQWGLAVRAGPSGVELGPAESLPDSTIQFEAFEMAGVEPLRAGPASLTVRPVNDSEPMLRTASEGLAISATLAPAAATAWQVADLSGAVGRIDVVGQYDGNASLDGQVQIRDASFAAQNAELTLSGVEATVPIRIGGEPPEFGAFRVASIRVADRTFPPQAGQIRVANGRGELKAAWPVIEETTVDLTAWIEHQAGAWQGELSASTPSFALMDGQRLGRLVPAFKDLSITGEFELEARAPWRGGRLAPTFLLRLQGASIGTAESTFAAEGVSGSIAIDSLAPVSTPPAQRLSIGHIRVGNLRFHDGQVDFRVEGRESVFIEHAQWGWGPLGYCAVHAVAFRRGDPQIELDVLLENIGLVEAGLKIDDSLVNELHRRFDELGDAWRGQT